MNKSLNIALFIVCSIFIIVVAFWTYRMFLYQPTVTEVKITYVLPTDSIQNSQALRITNEATDSLANVLKEQEEKLQQRYELFLKAREDDADITRMLSCLGAFILAMLGIFGIKSYKDLSENIERKAETKANEVASAKANEVAGTKANEIASAKANEIAERIATTIATEVASSTSTATISNLVTSSVQRVISERLSNSTYTEEIIQNVYDRVMPEITTMVESSMRNGQDEDTGDDQSTDDIDVASIDSMPPVSNLEPSNHD